MISAQNFRVSVLSTSALFLIMSAAATMAQTANGVAAATPSETVVVTGSHIRGVEAVGSNVLSLGQDDFLKNGTSNVMSMAQELPQLVNIGISSNTSFGGTRAQGASSNQTYTSSLNLRGVGVEATLTLVNGQRMAPTLHKGATDPNNIPTDMLSRMDVQADGGSAIYGSDAVAGTVNLILRAPTDIVQVTGQDTFKRGYSSWNGSFLVGKTWDFPGLGAGGILFDYQHTYDGSVSAAALPWAFNDNLEPYIGSAGLQSTSSSPGNVSGFGSSASAQAQLYAIPKTGISPTGQLTLSQLGTAGQPNRTSLYTKVDKVLPRADRDAVAFNMKQDVTTWLHFFAFGDYNRRSGVSSYGTTPQATATISVPNTNPYSPCATPAAAASAGLPPPSMANSQGLACPANGTIKVAYDFVNEIGPEYRIFKEKSFMETSGFEVDLPFEWRGTFSQSWSRDSANSATINTINSTTLAQAVSGVGRPAGVPFFNPFCSDQSGPCNSSVTDLYIQSNPQRLISPGDTNTLADYGLDFDGPVYDLPGGTMRLAVGLEYTDESLSSGSANSSIAPNFIVRTPNINVNRADNAAYGELFVPIISPEMNVPFINKLEFTGAIRYSHYSLGKQRTTNPKYGLNYFPIEELKIHASYGTSFRAPALYSAGDLVDRGIEGLTNVYQCGNYAGINLANCPAGAASPISVFYYHSGNSKVQPQKGKSWSLGADWAPSYIPGLTMSANWYRLVYTGQISEPGGSNYYPGTVVNAGYFDDLLIFNPTYFPNRAKVNTGVLSILPGLTRGAALTQAQFDSVFPTLISTPGYETNSRPNAPIAVISDGLQYNTGGIWTDGVDLAGQYYFDTNFGTAHLGYIATFVNSFRVQQVNNGPILQEDNKFGNSVRWRGRLEAGLAKDGWNATLYMNYINPYSADPTGLPPAALAYGDKFLKIASSLTWDFSAGYNLGEDINYSPLHNIQLQLVINNVLDKKPPFFLNGASQPAILFDPNQASALGRTVSLRLVKQF